MLISNLSCFNVIYILSVSFQVAGSLLLLSYSLSAKRKLVIRRFAGKGLLTRRGDVVEYNQDAYKKEYFLAYLNKISFGLIAGGYLMNVFGSAENICKTLAFVGILLFTPLIMFLSIRVASFLVSHLKADDKITNKDLKDFGIKPDMDFATSEDIDQIFENAMNAVNNEPK